MQPSQDLDRAHATSTEDTSIQSKPIFDEIRHNNVDYLKQEIHEGWDPSEQNTFKDNGFIIAARSGHLESLQELLLTQQINVNEKGLFDKTALMWASRWGHTDCVIFLLNAGAHVNEKDMNGNSALSLALHYNQAEVVHVLMEAGADILQKDNDGISVRDFVKLRSNASHLKSLYVLKTCLEKKWLQHLIKNQNKSTQKIKRL